MHAPGAGSLSARSVQALPQHTLQDCIAAAIRQAGGWLPFDRFMAMALYEPGLGYYADAARSSPHFGRLPASGSDFITAPELTPLFGQALARQVQEALQAADADQVFEFGAGSGALAAHLLGALGDSVRRYAIVDVSGTLRARQAERLAAFGDRVRWLDAWPDALHGVVIGNEVLDAMPVQLLHWDGAQWHERGVSLAAENGEPAAFVERGEPGEPGAPARGRAGPRLASADRPTDLRPPVNTAFAPGTTVETHLRAEAFIRTLAGRLQRGVALFIDYGFPEHEYYHPQRTGGTLMCHRGHLADTDPLADIGHKDITAHVNFSAIALAAQDAGLDVLGYTSQARFLLNCGLLNLLKPGDHRSTAAVQTLLQEHEMGELFKVIGLARGVSFAGAAHGGPLGFAAGDRSHTL